MDLDRAKTGREERALRILAALRASDRLFEVETADVDDLPLIELKIGDDYEDIARVSVGERCTAILPILLLESASPLVIDQPEDHLDNAFIYEVLLKTILRVKRGRQLVFATHNPNLPVLGDSERVLVLKSKDGGGYLSKAGTVDETREDIETILEGGREAFLRRSERYGHTPPPEDDGDDE
jgi:ATPase subunit of ABC transporter with duplicated ATPase domains